MSKLEKEQNRDLVYGINAVKEAVDSRPVEYVLVSQGAANPRLQQIIDGCRKRGVSVRFAPRTAIEREAGSQRHQDVVAVCSAKAYEDFESLFAGERPLLVFLDGVEDPANLGAIVRTSVAAEASGVVVPERRSAGLSPAVTRVAAGALEHAKIARVTNLVRAMAEAKERGLWIYGFEAKAEKSFWEIDYRGPCALVLGGEGHGLHRLVRETCDEVACIPIATGVESLNVSVAAAVVLYEVVRQRAKR